MEIAAQGNGQPTERSLTAADQYPWLGYALPDPPLASRGGVGIRAVQPPAIGVLDAQ